MSTNEIKRETSYGKLTIDSVNASMYQKAGTLTAQLRQVIKTKTTYPSSTISDGVSDNLFSMNEFDIEDGQTFENSETRVAFINVPAGSTLQMVELKIKALEDAGKKPCICKVISNEPILTPNQEAAIAKGLKTLDDFANSQVVRYGTNHVNAGQLILDDSGKVMYKRTFFKASHVEDENNCGTGEGYMSPAIAEELNAVVDSVEEQVNGLF